MIKHGFQPLDDEDKGKHGGRGGALCLVGMMWGVFYLFFLITFFPDWSHSTWQGEENLMGRVKRFNGVFLRCISPKQGSFKCDNYGQSSIRLGADLQAQRGLMLSALFLSLFAVIFGMASLRCTTLIDNESKHKSYMGIVTGVLFFLAGACTMTATIWYGVQVQKKYYDPIADDNSFKYEYGACLYVGWISAALSLIAGIMLVVGACKNMKSENNDTYYPATTYQPVSSKTTKLGRDKTEYV